MVRVVGLVVVIVVNDLSVCIVDKSVIVLVVVGGTVDSGDVFVSFDEFDVVSIDGSIGVFEDNIFVDFIADDFVEDVKGLVFVVIALVIGDVVNVVIAVVVDDDVVASVAVLSAVGFTVVGLFVVVDVVNLFIIVGCIVVIVALFVVDASFVVGCGAEVAFDDIGVV